MKFSLKNLYLTTLICSLSLIPSTINNNHLKNLKNENPITVNLNLNIEKIFNGTDSSSSRSCVWRKKIISWDQYATTWTQFTKKYNIMKFDHDSIFGVYSQYASDTVKGTQMNVNTNEILHHNDDNCTYGVDIDNKGIFATVWVNARCFIYHDRHDILYDIVYSQLSFYATQSSKFLAKINTITF